MKNEIDLRFCIWEYEDITHEYISNFLGITPLRVFTKGEKKNPNYSILSKINGWIMGSNLNNFHSFEDQLNAILDIIEPKIHLFKKLSKKYYCEFSCAVFIYYNNKESTPSINLTARYNKVNRELGAEFDFDIYCLPNSSRKKKD